MSSRQDFIELLKYLEDTQKTYNTGQYRRIDFEDIRTKILDIIQNDSTEAYRAIQHKLLKDRMKLVKYYNYNKNGYQQRFRKLGTKVIKHCANCQHVLEKGCGGECNICGTVNLYEDKLSNTKLEDPKIKFQKVIHEIDGTAKIPVFVQNYVNSMLYHLQSRCKNGIKIQFPLKFETFMKSRSDLGKGVINMLKYKPQEIFVPKCGMKEFQDLMNGYRQISDKWEHCSYKPEDAIYLETIYRHIYATDCIKFSNDDIELMLNLYIEFSAKFTQHSDGRVNQPIIRQVVLYMIMKWFRKYEPLTIFYKSLQISSTIPQVMELVVQEFKSDNDKQQESTDK